MGAHFNECGSMNASQRGIAMLELILSTALLSVTLVTLWSWQERHSQQQARTLQQAQALALVQRLSEHLQGLAHGDGRGNARSTSGLGWGWDAPWSEPEACRVQPCDPDAWQASLLMQWRQAVADALPSGQSQLVSVSGSESEWVIQIRWASNGFVNAQAPNADCPLDTTCLSQHVSWP